MKVQSIFTRSGLCLLGLLGLTLFVSPIAAQVFDSGPSDSALFDNVINIPSDPDIDNSSSCLLYTSPSPRDRQKSRMPSSA